MSYLEHFYVTENYEFEISKSIPVKYLIKLLFPAPV
jgi:hypothetical protein